MSGNTGLWIFTAAAIVIMVVFGASLYWAAGHGGSRRQALVIALCAPVLVAVLYVMLGSLTALNPAEVANQDLPAGHPPMDGSAPSMGDIEARVQGLADRLKDQPDNLEGWAMLGRSYTMLGRMADADAAYQHAKSLAMQNADMLISWIDVRLQLNDNKFDALTYELIDRASTLAPDDSNAMFLRALADFNRGDTAGSDALVAKLRERHPVGTPERQDLENALDAWMKKP